MLSNMLTLKPVLTTNDFLMCYDGDIDSNFQNFFDLDFELDIKYHSDRICPIIQLAKPENAQEIAQMFKEIYKGTYPYKKMEIAQEVEKMISEPNYQWFLFQLENKTVGCFGTSLEFEKKRGFQYGFVVKRDYHKVIDVFKAYLGCVMYLWNTYKNKIMIWYGEMRTNEATSQFFTSQIGLKPIAFFPNKDIFFNHVESDILQIVYDEDALYKFRVEEEPKIIRQVLKCYVYANKRYHLGTPIVENPNIEFNSFVQNEIKEKVIKISEKDRFNNEIITFSIKNSNSHFKFFYNPYSKNFEKTEYRVNSLDELFVFLQELKELIDKMDINYFECFVSAYDPTHQKVFFDTGFLPRGYVPCWYYDKEQNTFEDRIVFNYYKGDIDNNIKLIPESEELINKLKISVEKAIPDFSELFQE